MLLNLKDLNAASRQRYLQHAVAPRPIAFASTIGKDGAINLSPFSFFNLFSTNPPIVIFSPCRRVRDNTVKHTLLNVMEVPEVAINIVDINMVQQVSLSSCEYERGVNEFRKAGFTEEASVYIKPPLVKESKVKFECKVLEIKHLGIEGGAGNLIFCEIICMHIAEEILDEQGMIDPRKLNQVARLGDNWYAVVTSDNLFEVEKPNVRLGIGIDALPAFIRNSKILTGNQLGKLANVSVLPEADPAFADEQVTTMLMHLAHHNKMNKLETYIGELLNEDKVSDAWQVILLLLKSIEPKTQSAKPANER
ncbi:flavin reductase family protein [Danxiaibacter flavus]|uniref:Flavin reductase family protein n=1 Tax=Danxiaibacter flavus TaxID=3049108 RepID=A0ABV3ZIF9_9BACT|nr:flavin reductase family protein [Chitinophagaceae bacterium DXS]